MRPKKPHVASPDQVRITREGEYAIIEYADETVSTTHLKIGPKVQKMSDKEILNLHNELIRAREKFAAEYEHIAVEVPLHSPQLKYFKEGGYWTPRGGVLRCIIDQGEDGETTIWIDDKELSLQEFGKVLSVYAGWGMRIIFVPDDEIHLEPTVEVREPD
ncbi:hypothetical protein MYX84_11320 [Acidobacteria bacterium AH-259-O06]|nr:hypothetical protein [Acidobacteria bacterium AH-259-O06]